MAAFRLPWFRPKASLEERLRDFEQEVARAVEDRSWTIIPVDGGRAGPTWAYTVGLWTSGKPELIAFSPTVEGCARLISDVQASLQSGALELEDGLQWDGPRPGMTRCFRRVHDSQYLGFQWFRVTKDHYERQTGKREAIPAFQIFLPDNAGRYPWEADCAEGVRSAQPRLFLPFDPDLPAGGALADAPGV